MRFVIFAVTILLGPLAYAEALVVKEAWGRASVPGARAAAIYLTLENQGDEVLTVHGATVPVARHAMIHGSEIVDGMMRMRHVDELTIPAGEQIVFEPGGLHLMLMGLKEPFVEGQTIQAQLQFNKGAVDFSADIGAPDMMAPR